MNQTSGEKDIILNQLKEARTKIDDLLRQLKETIAERDYFWEQLNEATADRDSFWRKWKERIAEKESIWDQLLQTKEEKAALFEQLDRIYTSNFWKIASFCYKLRSKIPFAGSVHNLLEGLPKDKKTIEVIGCMENNNDLPEKTGGLEVGRNSGTGGSDRPLTTPETNGKYWSGKNIVWFGTSIPAGNLHISNSYPLMIAPLIGATVHNEAVGSSCVHFGSPDIPPTPEDPLGIRWSNWEALLKCLSISVAEKTTIIDNWWYWKNNLGPNWQGEAPGALTTSLKDYYLGCCYDRKLDKHLGSNRPDLYVFDHGHNDLNDHISEIPSDYKDRRYFIGAMNFLIDRILKDNPKARICFIGHYENDRKTAVSEAQEVLAEYWDFPFLRLWEKTGWSQKQIETTGYWTDGVWTLSGGAPQTLSLTQIWMPDDLHPESDSSGSANRFLASIISEFVETVR